MNAILPTVIFARDKGYKRVIVPVENAIEAALIPNIEIIPANNLNDLIAIISGEKPIIPQPVSSIDDIIQHDEKNSVDFGQIVGQNLAKRALLIAAAGGHNLLME